MHRVRFMMLELISRGVLRQVSNDLMMMLFQALTSPVGLVVGVALPSLAYWGGKKLWKKYKARKDRKELLKATKSHSD